MADPSFHELIVIGAGMAGASLAAEVSGELDTVVLEGESRPGYHSTGRSAAIFIQNYGPAAVRVLSAASRGFLTSPPPGFAEFPLIRARGALMVAHPGQEAALEALARESPGMERLSAQEAVARVPSLRRNQVADALFEPDAVDIDVDGLHQGYLRSFKSKGGRLVGNARVTGIEVSAGDWRVTTTAGTFAAPRVVNAAGAWADEIAQRAGVPRIGLTPKRRTALLISAPEAAENWPLVADVGSTWYCRPEAGGKLLVSPADETPVAPSDVRPEEIDIARAVERLETAMDLSVRRIEHSWAGLRTFTQDGALAIGPDPEAQGFFWVAGQGGYGIQTAPAAARLGASLLLDRSLPAELLEHGVTAIANAPGRFSRGSDPGR